MVICTVGKVLNLTKGVWKAAIFKSRGLSEKVTFDKTWKTDGASRGEF